jgi:TFIIF-interacting CTD phosphatase-like protein
MHLLPNVSLTDWTIVLDIDETLVHTEEDTEGPDVEIKTDPILVEDLYDIHLDKGTYKMWGTKRPHLDEFLLFCFTYFKNVCVWSAGQTDYVHAVVKKIFRDFRAPDIIYTFDQCVQNERGDWIKPLEKFFDDKNVQAKGIVPSKTYIIDDRDYTFERNVDNGIQIPEYAPDSADGLHEEEDHLMRLKGWLMKQFADRKTDTLQKAKKRIFYVTLKTYYKSVEAKIVP